MPTFATFSATCTHPLSRIWNALLSLRADPNRFKELAQRDQRRVDRQLARFGIGRRRAAFDQAPQTTLRPFNLHLVTIDANRGVSHDANRHGRTPLQPM